MRHTYIRFILVNDISIIPVERKTYWFSDWKQFVASLFGRNHFFSCICVFWLLNNWVWNIVNVKVVFTAVFLLKNGIKTFLWLKNIVFITYFVNSRFHPCYASGIFLSYNSANIKFSLRKCSNSNILGSFTQINKRKLVRKTCKSAHKKWRKSLNNNSESVSI